MAGVDKETLKQAVQDLKKVSQCPKHGRQEMRICFYCWKEIFCHICLPSGEHKCRRN